MSSDIKPNKIQLLFQEMSNYSILFNEIDKRYYIIENGITRQVSEKELNSIYLKLKSRIPALSKSDFWDYIGSNFIRSFNPLRDYFENSNTLPHIGLIKELSSTIKSSYGFPEEEKYLFLKKWLLGLISSIYGQHSPLMLVLAGDKQNTGKTEWFRRLLPDALNPYFAESVLGESKDSEILMTEKILILDDELGGKNKKDFTKLKQILSKQKITVRLPYGRMNRDFTRIAVLAGTTNNEQLLYDTTGNRRMIIMHVDTIDQNKYNAIDKDALWMEVFALYQKGETHHLSKNEIDILNKNSIHFQGEIIEEQLLLKHFHIGSQGNPHAKFISTTDILKVLEEDTNRILSLNKLGSILKKHSRKKHSKDGKKGWYVIPKKD